MDLIDVETGPWGGLVLLALLVAVIGALVFTTTFISAVLLIAIVLVPIALVLFFGGKRLGRRLIHGSR